MPLECMNRGQWPRPKPEQKDFDRESYLYWSAAWEHDRAVAAETRLAAAEQMIRDNLGSQWLDLLKARAASADAAQGKSNG